MKGNLAGGKSSESQAKLIAVGDINFGKCKPSLYSYSDATRNWWGKLWRIRNKSPISPKFPPICYVEDLIGPVVSLKSMYCHTPNVQLIDGLILYLWRCGVVLLLLLVWVQ